MKNTFFTLVAILSFALFAISSNAKTPGNDFSGYEIIPVTDQNLDVGADKAWVLSYDKNETPIVITLYQTKRSKYYVVRTDHFEVAYVCNKKGFGASYVKSEYSQVPFAITNSVINEKELDRQRILSSDQVNNEKALDLIAAYLPDLVNPGYRHLLN